MADTHHSPESSNIVSATYDPETKVLSTTFKTGGTWEHTGVDPETWEGYKAAPSKGTYLHRQVRGRFGTRKA